MLNWETKKTHRGTRVVTSRDISITYHNPSGKNKSGRYGITFRNNSVNKVLGDNPAVIIAKDYVRCRIYLKGESKLNGYALTCHNKNDVNKNRYAELPVDLSDYLGDYDLQFDDDLKLYYIQGLDWSKKNG